MLLKCVYYRKGFFMKKMTFLFIISFVCAAALFSSENDTILSSSAFFAINKDDLTLTNQLSRANSSERIERQRLLRLPKGSSRSPSPCLSRILHQKRQSPAHSVTQR